MITISRLYDNYSDASRAVAELERAGIPHSDISIIASNAEGWYGRDHTSGRVDRDHDGVDDRAEGAAAGPGSARPRPALPASSPVSGSWRSPVSGRSSRRDGSPRRHWESQS